MLNYIWLGLIVLAVLIGGFTGRVKEVVDGSVKSAETAVTLSLGLIGIMALWLGIMRLAEKAGLVQALARLLRPLMRWLFPDVPTDHPAMGSMVMNIAANVLGLSNAATPLGLQAMKHLESLNRIPGTATNAMCTFLTINTGSVQLIPITAVAVLAANGSKNPSAIIGSAFLATLFASAAGLIAVKLLERLKCYRLPEVIHPLKTDEGAVTTEEAPPALKSEPALKRMGPLEIVALVGFIACFVWFAVQMAFGKDVTAEASTQSPYVRLVNTISLLAVPFLIAFFPLYAALRRIPVYEEFVEGAKEGFHVAVKIIPFLVTMLVAIGMFRGAGGIDMITDALRGPLMALGFPPELVPMSLMRPLSGSGSLAIFTELAKQMGPDHIVTLMAGTIFGSTETTFYVIAVYFGSVGIRRTRHAVPAGLISDFVGLVASVIICRWMFS